VCLNIFVIAPVTLTGKDEIAKVTKGKLPLAN
jgi:hypothetical protein